MNLEELIDLRCELSNLYESEKKKLNTNSSVNNNELSDISKEIIKLNHLINIYHVDDVDYRVMKLERLYVMIISEFNEEDFNKLDEEKMFEIFNNSFPKTWIYKYNSKEKEQLLLDAICNNRFIQIITDSI